MTLGFRNLATGERPSPEIAARLNAAVEDGLERGSILTHMMVDGPHGPEYVPDWYYECIRESARREIAKIDRRSE